MSLSDDAEDAERRHGMNPFHDLEHLAAIEVPPVPSARTFTAGVRRKLHPRLLALHILQFAFGATTWALVHMTAALAAAARYTLTGTWPDREKRG
ncbi:MAG: hypothetical protein EBZ74_00365 [Planctomycetia bacterium]|nr:hypothetical protein [Planctomycetia bacterium]